MRGIVVLRVVMVALALTLSVVLIASGRVVIGALIGLLALARLAMFFMLMRRRREFRRRFPRRWEQRQ
jgi:hypothetical protein